MAKGKPTSQEGEEVVGADGQVSLSSTSCEDCCARCGEGSDQEKDVPSDDGEEETDGSEGSDFGDIQDRVQGWDTMSNSLLEHSGTKNT